MQGMHVTKTMWSGGPECQAVEPGMQMWKYVQLCLILFILHMIFKYGTPRDLLNLSEQRKITTVQKQS